MRFRGPQALMDTNVYQDLGHNYRIADHPPRTFSFPFRNAVGIWKRQYFCTEIDIFC